MARRKTHRQRRPPAPRSRRPAGPAPSHSPPDSGGTSQPSSADLRQEYHYVITDLKRIGLTAAAMFALLAVLALTLT
ncbi:MAG: hypothetical protein HPY83_01445 [Anaerolineae bacterium]|nr:hypothetical protein [Anaerolineae bacterium]